MRGEVREEDGGIRKGSMDFEGIIIFIEVFFLEEILGEASGELGNKGFTVHTVAERFGHGGLGHP